MIGLVKNTIGGIVCLITLYSCKSINPEPPSLTEIKIPGIQQYPSKIDLPVTIDLKEYFKKAETSVSNIHSDSMQECEGLRYAYMLQRSPFKFHGSGNKIMVSVEASYWIKLSYCAKCESGECKVPTVGGSCGVDEPMRKMKIAYSSSFSVLKNYQIRSSTSLVNLEPENKCEVTIFDINATHKLIEHVREPLVKVGKKIDERIARVDLKPQMQNLWNKISEEIKLGSYGYLTINPEALSYNKLTIDGSVLKTTFGVGIKPTISTESNQQTVSTLPMLSDYSPGSGFNLNFDIWVSYDSLTKHLNKHLKGKTIDFNKNSVVISNSKVYGIGNQKVVIAIEFKGDREGIIYFTGTPHYNSNTNELTFPDLQFDTRTQDLLIKIGEWFNNEKIVATIREKANFNFSNLVSRGQQKFQEGINRNLGENVILTGEVDSLIIQKVYPLQSRLLLRVFALGNLEVKVK